MDFISSVWSIISDSTQALNRMLRCDYSCFIRISSHVICKTFCWIFIYCAVLRVLVWLFFYEDFVNLFCPGWTVRVKIGFIGWSDMRRIPNNLKWSLSQCYILYFTLILEGSRRHTFLSFSVHVLPCAAAALLLLWWHSVQTSAMFKVLQMLDSAL